MPSKHSDWSALAPLPDGSTAGELIPELVRHIRLKKLLAEAELDKTMLFRIPANTTARTEVSFAAPCDGQSLGVSAGIQRGRGTSIVGSRPLQIIASSDRGARSERVGLRGGRNQHRHRQSDGGAGDDRR